MAIETHLQSACCDLLAEVVRSAGSAKLKVTGLSMLPAIWPGDVLTIRRQSPDLLQPGQIILYQRNGRLIAHRIMRVSGEELIAQGDCVPSFDHPVHASQVVGQVVGVSRNGRVVILQQSLGQRAAAWVLRRSEWCTRILLHLHAAK